MNRIRARSGHRRNIHIKSDSLLTNSKATPGRVRSSRIKSSRPGPNEIKPDAPYYHVLHYVPYYCTTLPRTMRSRTQTQRFQLLSPSRRHQTPNPQSVPGHWVARGLLSEASKHSCECGWLCDSVPGGESFRIVQDLSGGGSSTRQTWRAGEQVSR